MDTTTQTDAPTGATTTKRASSPRAQRIEHSAAIAAWARAHPQDPSGKGMRTKLRAEKAKGKACADPAYLKHAKNAPWPSHSRKVLRALFENDRAFLDALDGKGARKRTTKGTAKGTAKSS